MSSVQETFDQFRILIVEDDENARTILADFLRDLGLVVYLAENGMQGFIKAKEINPHAILMDIMMPRLDGVNVVEKIRTEVDATIPIIMTTALHRKDDVQKAMKAGANDYLVKPIDLKLLQQRLAANLGVGEEELAKGQSQVVSVNIMDHVVVLRLKGRPDYEAISDQLKTVITALKDRDNAPARLVIDFSHADPDAIHDAMLDTIYSFSEAVRVDMQNVLQVVNDHQLSGRLTKHPIGKYFKRLTDFNSAVEALRH